MTLSNLTWLWYLLGGVLALGALVLLVRTIIGDRSKGRRRCPRCWYELGAIATLTCPECGRAAKSEKHLLKTRRRWGRATLAIAALLALSAAVSGWPFERTSWWARVLPDRVLVWLYPVLPESSFDERIQAYYGIRLSVGKRLWGELRRRISEGVFDEDVLIGLVDDIVEKDSKQLIRDLDRSEELLPRARHALLCALVEASVITRDRWPANETVYAQIRPHWRFAELRAGVEDLTSANLEIRMMGSDQPPQRLMGTQPFVAWTHSTVSTSTGQASGLVVGTPAAPDDPTLEFIVENSVSVSPGPPYSRSWPAGKSTDFHRFVRTIEVVGDPHSVMTPVRDAALDDAIRAAISGTMHTDPRSLETWGGLTVSLARGTNHLFAVPEDVAVGLIVQFCYRGEPLATIEWSEALSPAVNTSLFGPQGTATINGDLSRFFDDTVAMEDLSVRAVSDVGLALSDFGRSKYWVGEIELPVAAFRFLRQAAPTDEPRFPHF